VSDASDLWAGPTAFDSSPNKELLMAALSPSALITDEGRRVGLRMRGRLYELSQEELRSVLGLPSGPPGLGITIDHNRFHFEFAADQRTIDLSAELLQRRLAKQLASRT
jgi:hypothetical protein